MFNWAQLIAFNGSQSVNAAADRLARGDCKSRKFAREVLESLGRGGQTGERIEEVGKPKKFDSEAVRLRLGL